MEMIQLPISYFLQQFTGTFFLNQVLTILILFAFGLFVMSCLGRGVHDCWTVLLAYPIGLAVYVLASFFLLLVHIPYKTWSVLLTLFIFSMLLLLWKKPIKCLQSEWKQNRWKLLLVTVTVVLLAVIAVSGILSVSLSNDSMYYYSMYSRALVKYGEYRREFNVFLTDVGQGAAIVGTLPFFFGFNETFGIQQFFNMNFICIFAYAVFEQAKKAGLCTRHKAEMIAGFSILVLLSSMPFLIVSKWAMANVYFMEYLFIFCYLAYRFQPIGEKCEEGILFTLGILIAMLSILRMEGTIFVLFTLLCISMLAYKNRDLFCSFLLPVALLQLAYDIRVFISMDIIAPYTFLTEKKAFIQMVGLGMVAIYFLVIRGRFFVKLQRHIQWIIMGGLLFCNIGLFSLDTSLYVGNLQAFAKNLFNQSGWGLLPCFAIAVWILLPKKGYSFAYSDLLWLGYLLTTLAVCWARDGVLREGVGDSGNRVLLQIVPLVVYALTMQVIWWLGTIEKEKL